MLPFKLVYSDGYYLPIGQHVLPAEKYRRVRDRLLTTGVAEATDFLDPEPASDQDILLVHKPDYVHKLKTGTLSPREEMELEVPFSPELVKAFWLAAGGSILAARQALTDRVAINIGGGFHRGGFAVGKPRVLATVTYSSPASLASLTERNFSVRPDSVNGLGAEQRYALS